MRQRGKPSARAIETQQSPKILLAEPLPAPPPELSAAEETIWRDVVATMPAKWLTRACLPLIAEYARRVARARFLAAQIQRFAEEWLREEGGLERFDRLLVAADRESRAIVNLARSLRISPHAIAHPTVAGREADKAPSGPRPWDFTGRSK